MITVKRLCLGPNLKFYIEMSCHYSFPIDSSRVTAGHEIEIAASLIFLSFFKLVDSGLVSKPYSLLLHAKKKPFECSDNSRGPSLYYVSKVTGWVVVLVGRSVKSKM